MTLLIRLQVRVLLTSTLTVVGFSEYLFPYSPFTSTFVQVDSFTSQDKELSGSGRGNDVDPKSLYKVSVYLTTVLFVTPGGPTDR